MLTSTYGLSQSRAVYKSEADDLVTIRNLTLLPVFDNLQGIYSRPIEAHLLEKLKKNHNLEYSDSQTVGPIVTPEELESSEDLLKQTADGINSDAFIAYSVIKGPKGVDLRASLYLKADYKLFATVSVNDVQKLDIDSLKTICANTLADLLKKIPYAGIVLSRQGTRVTVNLGRRDNVVPDQILPVIQIIKLNRHPKFNFLISTEKEIVGKIKVLKVDETLSFGRIITEVEAGTIQAKNKIGYQEQINYTNTNSLSDVPNQIENLNTRPEGKLTFGDGPQEWIPKKTPTFGAVGARFGIGQFRENVEKTPSESSNVPYYPAVAIDAELWLTPEWSIHSNIRQGIVSDSGLSRSLSAYGLLFGYNMRLAAAFNAPKVEALFGFCNYRMTSDTDDFSTKTYSGLMLGVAGSYPLPSSDYSLGAQMNFMMSPKLKETPSSSGSPDNSVNSFGFFVEKPLSINIKARAQIDFELYSSDFSGGSTESSSQKHTTLSAGAAYLF
jgi:hypothetical protein